MKLVISLREQDFQRTKSVGIMNVSLGLARGLASAAKGCEIYLLANNTLQSLPTCGAAEIHQVFHDQPAPRGWSRVWWDQIGVVRAADALTADWLILPKGFPPLCAWPHGKVCCYLHDNVFAYYQKRGDNPFPWFERIYFPAMIRRAARKAGLIVTNSEFTRQEIMTLHPAGRCERLGIGFAQPKIKQPQRRGDGILLLTSSFPHKLTQQAVVWLSRWEKKSGSQHVVHGIGSLPRAFNWPKKSNWRLHARLPQKEYLALKNECAVLLYFSAYEGYGMPPVEALLEGLPALASGIPATREILPPEMLFSNDRYDDFAAKLNRILTGNYCPGIKIPTWEELGEKLFGLLAMQESNKRGI